VPRRAARAGAGAARVASLAGGGASVNDDAADHSVARLRGGRRPRWAAELTTCDAIALELGPVRRDSGDVGWGAKRDPGIVG